MKYISSYELPILDALTHISPQSSKNTLRSWIKEGRIYVDDVQVKNTSHVVLKDQLVTIGQRKKIIRPGLPIIYEDRDLVVIDKPSGLLSVSTAFEKEETAHTLLKEHYYPKKVFVVHRLDQDTSGVMVFALTQQANDQMKKLFEVHAIERAYTAIIEGQLKEPSGTWESYQIEDRQYHVHETDDQESGRRAVTHYRQFASSRKYSALELRLETGRKNQIRVHCQAAGHPVAGDKKYGAQTNPLKRLCLHAHLLAFRHPFTKQDLRLESPPPESFYRIVPNALS